MTRPAMPGDLQSVLDIAAAGFTLDRFGPAWLVRRVSLSGVSLMVDDAGAGLVRGFILASLYDTGFRVDYIAVGPEYRRQGVGRRLLAAVRGPASAWVRSENAASRGLFAAAGWELAVPPRTRKGDWCYFALPGSARRRRPG